MSQTGPRPKPTNLKILQGTARPDRLNRHEPQPAAASIRAPANLPAGAKKAWRELARPLADLGLLTEIDRPALVMVCIHLDIARQAAAELEEQGLTRLDENKVERKNPYLQILRDQSAQLRQWALEFGLTPSARTRVKGAAVEVEDPFEELLERRRR
ncbi:MAG: phage terminase small subunit P27 family [Caldilineales bacterium]|nr:phage terminase small subunit P27 family [Caldilineales bacterium]